MPKYQKCMITKVWQPSRTLLPSPSWCWSPEDWHNATQVARAFKIGKSEALAISNLQDKINKQVVVLLKEATRCRGMRQFMNHDLLSKDLFNVGFSSGETGALSAWPVDLSNNPDNNLDSR